MVRLYAPAAVTFLSMERLPEEFNRPVQPVGAAFIVPIDPPAANRRSFVFVVVSVPLFMVVPEPAPAEAASNGFTLSMPAYSCACTIANELTDVANVAVMVFVPVATFLA